MRPTPRPKPISAGVRRGEDARSGAACRPPLRDLVDRQETARRGHAARGRAVARKCSSRRLSRSISCSSPQAPSSCFRSASGPMRRRGRPRFRGQADSAPHQVRPQAPFAQGGDRRRVPVRALLSELVVRLDHARRPRLLHTGVSASCRSPAPARRRACPCPMTSGSPRSSRRPVRPARAEASLRSHGRSG